MKGVVPEGDGVGPHHSPVYPDDISWTSAYPLIAQWLLQYYGDVGVVEDHWESLKVKSAVCPYILVVR